MPTDTDTTPITTHLLVADDHRIVLQGIRTLLSALPGVLIDTATTAEGVLRTLTASPYSYSAAVIDLDLPGADGISLLAAIAAQSPHTRVIVYTMHEELWVARQLQHAPMAGVVLKSEPPRAAVGRGGQCARGRRVSQSAFPGHCRPGPDLWSERPRDLGIRTVGPGTAQQGDSHPSVP